MSTKATSFPIFAPGQGYGTTHFEHGRTWEYVEPGMWKSVGGSGGGSGGPGGEVTWDGVTGKPTEFPPETHGHEIADVDGLQDALDAAGGAPAWDDVTGKPTEFPPAAHNQDWSTITNTPSEYPPEAHTHGQDEVDGLELRLEAIEDSITSGGGFVDAPDDGQLYGRQSEAWAVVPAGGASSWDDLTDKPTDFPPSDHTHEIDEVNGLQDALNAAGGAPAWDDVTGKPTEFPPEAHQHGWDDVTGKPADYPPSTHGHAWDEITGKPSEFPPASHNHDGVYQPVGDYIGEAPNDGEEYARKNEGWVKLQDHNYTGADAVKLTGDQSVAGHKTWTGLATFGQRVAFRDSVNGDTSANFGEDVTARSFIRSGGTSDQYLMADGSVSVGSSSNTLEGAWAYNASTAGDGEWTSRNTNWLNITTVTLNKSDATGYEHNFVLMNAGDVMFIQAPSGGGEFNITEKTVSGETTTFTLDPIASYGSFPSAGDSTQINFIPQVSAGSNVTIGPSPPDPALEGMQWLEVPATPGEEATMWVHDGAKWLQHPGGKDGKDGSDGADGLWTDNGDTSISYNGGNVGIGVSSTPWLLHASSDSGPRIRVENTTDAQASFDLKTATRETRLITDPSSIVRVYDQASDSDKLNIDASGNATFSGTIGHVPADNISGYLYSYDGAVLFQALNAGDSSAVPFEIWTGTNKRFVVGDDGNVGIGTDAPASALHVQGDYLTVKNEAGDVFGYLQGLDGQCFEIGTANASTVKTLSFATDGGSQMTIGADGWVNMANNQVDVGIANGNEPTISFKQADGATRFQFLMNPSNFGFYIWDPVLAQSRMQLDSSGNLYAYGNIYKNNSTPVIATSDMVKAFSKLRDAVKDEQTVESLKESITNWIGGMIEEWESMQSPATQEISDE